MTKIDGVKAETKIDVARIETKTDVEKTDAIIVVANGLSTAAAIAIADTADTKQILIHGSGY